MIINEETTPHAIVRGGCQEMEGGKPIKREATRVIYFPNAADMYLLNQKLDAGFKFVGYGGFEGKLKTKDGKPSDWAQLAKRLSQLRVEEPEVEEKPKAKVKDEPKGKSETKSEG